MSIFDINPNEESYVHGKKHWADVIKNSGSEDTLIWRQPEEDFNINSTLIVMPGEEAVFVQNGDIEAVFQHGRYKLKTQNYPIFSRVRNAFTGGISTFNCVVFFVRISDSKEIKWGTDSPFQVRDKVWGVVTNVKSRGAYRIHIDNPALFLEKLIGSNSSTLKQQDILEYFKHEFQMNVKTILADYLNNYNNELIGLDSKCLELSHSIRPSIDATLKEYGLTCVSFTISAITIDSNKYDQIDQAQVGAYEKIKLAQGDKEVMSILGDDWERQQIVNIMGDMANNPNGGMMGAGVGFGMGVYAGEKMGNMYSNLLDDKKTISNNSDIDNASHKLKKLKEMMESGLITEDEYNSKKMEILDKI